MELFLTSIERKKIARVVTVSEMFLKPDQFFTENDFPYDKPNIPIKMWTILFKSSDELFIHDSIILVRIPHIIAQLKT